MQRFICLAFFIIACSSNSPAAPDAAGSCIEHTACDLDGAPGLCTGGACGTCTDRTDDAACAAVYPGALCVQGACVAATCHDGTDCGGKQCIDNQCVGCTTDDQCDTGQVCNAGVCSDAVAACSGDAIGAACGTSGGMCCNRSATLTCVDVQCCNNSQCGPTESCQAGACVPTASGCLAPTAPTYYVDPAYAGPSTGSSACPFKTLHGAFATVRNDDFTTDSDVIIKGGTINAASEGGASYFPLTVPASVYVRTQGTAATDAVIVAPANTTAFEAPFGAQPSATAPFSSRLSHLEIKQASPGTAGTAVHVTGSSDAKRFHLDHLDIHNFFNGINIDTGHAELAWGVSSHDNASAGLYIAAGRADIIVGANADARSSFESNQVGILVTSDPKSILVATGSEDAQGLKQIDANSNREAGIRIYSPNANNALTNVGANFNGNSGLSVFCGAAVVVRHSRFKSNMQSGIRINANGSVTDVAGIDVGTSNSDGVNELGNNADADLCINANTNDFVRAAGNAWEATDCTVAGGHVPLRLGACAGAGAGVAYTGSFLIPAVVAKCTFQ